MLAIIGCAKNDQEVETNGQAEAETLPRDPRASNSLSAEEIADGWILLFDGETLFGWKNTGDADWRVEGGVLKASSGKPGWLYTTSRFGDFVLSVDFRMPENGNSGVFLRTIPEPVDVTKDCYEVNIALPEENDYPTGSLVQRQKADGSCDLTKWHNFEIRAVGGDFVVKLDGEIAAQYTDPEPIPAGHIGLQFRQGEIQFCNIKLKPLGMRPLFDGKTLDGWKQYPEMPSRFTVSQEGWLHVEDGRGQLETEEQFGDFIFRTDVRVNGDDLNSGIFFRCIPGEQMNGYECQIHNGFENGDRTQPKDCGTGGFFRRQNARRIVADDHEWFTLTLLADGPHMAAWVNGFQVSDWIDTRSPDPNPRKGLRLEPGTIMIQGHDPTTNLDFRNIQISELEIPSSNTADE
ncbi:DUF1080 domain-containing protein [Thermostilla marina]